MDKILLVLAFLNVILLSCLLYALTLQSEVGDSNHRQLFNNQSDILTALDEQKKCVK